MEAGLAFHSGLSREKNGAPDKKGKGEDKAPADGPARVVKSGDWGGVPDQSMKGFAMESFAVPGRVQHKANAAEARILEMAKEARKAEDAHKKALQKSAQDSQASVQAAFAK